MAHTLLYNAGSDSGQATLVVFEPNGEQEAYPISEVVTMIGRKSEKSRADIMIASGIVSRSHGEITALKGKFYYRDLDSTNGTYDRRTLLGVHSPEELKASVLNDSDLLVFDLPADGKHHPQRAFALFAMCDLSESSWQRVPLNKDIAEIMIGRSEESGLVVESDLFSEKHASFFAAKNGWAIIDHQSTNGVYINGKRLNAPRYLKEYDVVRIIDTYFIFLGDELLVSDIGNAVHRHEAPAEDARQEIPETPAPIAQQPAETPKPVTPPPPQAPCQQAQQQIPYQQPQKAPYQQPAQQIPYQQVPPQPQKIPYQPQQIPYQQMPPQPSAFQPVQPKPAAKRPQLVINIVERSVISRFRKMILLQDINLSIANGEMVLILGGSGAGKTTFINAVMGYEKANGRIEYKNTNIYEEYEQMKYEIGFVPQQDLLRNSDSVYDTLSNAADMKLPSRITPEEKAKRIDAVLEELGLTREKKSLVSKLSGGQKKRLSIAVEFISNPSLFFLDEPDSGLDGIMGRGLMENLRSIADKGTIVMIITHAPDRAADLFNKVIVLAKSTKDNCGHLAFFGSIDDAYRFFEVDSLEKIVKRINRPDENGEGLSDFFIDKYNSIRQNKC